MALLGSLKGVLTMALDPIQAARLYRNQRSRSQRKQPHQAHIPHVVMADETLDPSLSNRRVYDSRADWYAAAAMNGFYDAAQPVPTGARRYLTQPELTTRKPQGMKLYD